MRRAFRGDLIPHLPEISGFDWNQTAGRRRALEIGAGTGLHALSFSSQHPDTFLIALERTLTKFSSFQRQISMLTTPPHNLFALQADALWWCAQNLNKAFPIDQVFILYPNPYPKKKQANLRFANMPFVGFLIEHMGRPSTLEVSTNEEFYVEEVQKVLPTEWGLEIEVARKLPPGSQPRTAFEKKYLDRGEPCFQCIFRKS